MKDDSERMNNYMEALDNTIVSLVEMAALPMLEIEPFLVMYYKVCAKKLLVHYLVVPH